VRSAVILMRTGAGIAALSALAVLSGNSAYAATAARAASAASVTPLTVLVVLAWLVVVGLWLWQASAAQQGHTWVRTVGSVLLGAFTLLQGSALYLGAITQHSAAAVVFVHRYDGLLTLLTWPVGLAVIVLLWLRPSGQYFRFR
jgi:hypothetical protein